ncbi:C-C motif chemokine 27 [Orycteropus afer afer]|uniref:C-C motif chemokine 27 n=1 Tax=Orycteropus afer afer TaxID=1230840 RepID=A0A8B7AGV2_ORYAF|nr:C-C motif chemokine 27 [Orycteropus afer afer]
MEGALLPSSLLLLLLLVVGPDPGAAFLQPPALTCCTELYQRPLSDKLLRKVTRVELQMADGDCHLQAFVLHLARRSVCIHPKNRSLAQWFANQGRGPRGTLSNLNLGLLGKRGSDPQQPKQ